MPLRPRRAEGLQPQRLQRRQVRQRTAEQVLRFRPTVILRDRMRADMQRPHNRVPAFSGAQAPKQFV